MIRLSILSPELEQHFVNESLAYWEAIGNTIDTAIEGRQVGAGYGLRAGSTGIVNERMFTPHSAGGWPGNISMGEMRVPRGVETPTEYNWISARYIEVSNQGSLWLPNWFPEEPSRNPMLEYDADITDTVHGLNRVHGESSHYRRALVTAPEAMRHQMRPALVRAGYLLAQAGVIEVPATLLPAEGLEVVL